MYYNVYLKVKYLQTVKIKHLLVQPKIYFLVLVITDSSHAITQDVSLVETAKAAEFFLTDGIIVTGTATGQPAKPHDVTGMKL